VITKYHRDFLIKAAGMDPNSTDAEAADHLRGLHPDLRKACQNYAEAVRDEEGDDDDGDDDDEAERHLQARRDTTERLRPLSLANYVVRSFACPSCHTKYSQRHLPGEQVEPEAGCGHCRTSGHWQFESDVTRAGIITAAGNVVTGWTPQRPEIQNEKDSEPGEIGVGETPEQPEFECGQCGARFRDKPNEEATFQDRRCPSCDQLLNRELGRQERYEQGQESDEDRSQALDLACRRLNPFQGALRRLRIG